MFDKGALTRCMVWWYRLAGGDSRPLTAWCGGPFFAAQESPRGGEFRFSPPLDSPSQRPKEGPLRAPSLWKPPRAVLTSVIYPHGLRPDAVGVRFVLVLSSRALAPKVPMARSRAGRVRTPAPTKGNHPGGGEGSEGVKGYDAVSGSGARGTAGRREGAAGQ